MARLPFHPSDALRIPLDRFLDTHGLMLYLSHWALVVLSHLELYHPIEEVHVSYDSSFLTQVARNGWILFKTRLLEDSKHVSPCAVFEWSGMLARHLSVSDAGELD